MARADLLALTLEDLAVISNWGLVKRAQREFNEGRFSSAIHEDPDGSVTVEWSDPVTCHLPAGSTPQESQCSCPAITCCRHLIRSILAYQAQAQIPAESDPEDPLELSSGIEVWDPGEISDVELERFIPKATLTRYRRRFEQEQVIEVFRGQKPAARLHSLGHYVRFLVPHDLRYTYCDCPDPTPCIHVALAIWGFRALAPQQTQGLIFPTTPVTPPTVTLDRLEHLLNTLIDVGLAHLPPPLQARLQQMQQICAREGWIWLASIWDELIQQQQWYVERDARCSPLQIETLLGELWMRITVLRHSQPSVPIPFVGGISSHRTSALGTSRLIGLGCGVQVRPWGITLAAYFQQMDSGRVVLHSQEILDPEADPKGFDELAQGYAWRQSRWLDLGASQILMRGGKCTPEGRVLPGRQLTITSQTWQWQDLKPPVLIQDSSELRSHLALQPPACLRPRRLTENFYVWQVDRVESFRFDPMEQAIRGRFRDLAGHAVEFSFPYFQRSRWGTEALLYRLQADPLLFISGQVGLSQGNLVLTPVGLVFDRGGERSLLQPWIQGPGPELIGAGGEGDHPADTEDPLHPVKTYLNQIEIALGELILTGLQEQDPHRISQWRRLHQQGHRWGFRQLCDRLEGLIAVLAKEREDLPMSGGAAVLDLAIGLRALQEVSLNLGGNRHMIQVFRSEYDCNTI